MEEPETSDLDRISAVRGWLIAILLLVACWYSSVSAAMSKNADDTVFAGFMLAVALFGTLIAISFAIWQRMTHRNPLDTFLAKWEVDYEEQLALLPLFDTKETKKWSWEQKRKFVRYFYHARGHFYPFLWNLANASSSQERRKVLLANMRDELGAIGSGRMPHEHLFERFAAVFDVSLSDHDLETAYEPFLETFNRGHLDWIAAHDDDSNWAMFSAYELLDNVDYRKLRTLAETIGARDDALEFFTVHASSAHFDATDRELQRAWKRDESKIRAAFEFVAEHQLRMWKGISDAVHHE